MHQQGNQSLQTTQPVKQTTPMPTASVQATTPVPTASVQTTTNVCQGLKASGIKCTNKSQPGSDYCGVHAKQSPSGAVSVSYCTTEVQSARKQSVSNNNVAAAHANRLQISKTELAALIQGLTLVHNEM